MTISVDSGGEHKGGGKRSEIKGFSAESRYRLFRMLHTLTFERVTFVTLTYPAVFPSDGRIYKAHLKEYRRRMERLYGPLRAVWRLEFQDRGAPHFHIMYLDAPFIDIHDWCWMWKCVVGSYDMAHELLGVDVKLVTGKSEAKLISSYLAKYVGKVVDETGVDHGKNVGRYWGKWNIEEPEAVEYQVDDRAAQHIVSYALSDPRNASAWYPVDASQCAVFGFDLGSRDFSNRVAAYVEKARLYRKPRKA